MGDTWHLDEVFVRIQGRTRDEDGDLIDIRHTACTRMLEAGIPLSVVAKILGWSPSTTAMMAKRYGHIGNSALRKAVTVLDTSDGHSTEGGYKNGYSGDQSEKTDPLSS